MQVSTPEPETVKSQVAELHDIMQLDVHVPEQSLLHTSVMSAQGLPWSSLLHQEGSTVRVAISGVKLNVVCRNGEETESSSTYTGNVEPMLRLGMSALHPSALEFDPAAGELALEGSEGVSAQLEGKFKMLGEEEQEVFSARTG